MRLLAFTIEVSLYFTKGSTRIVMTEEDRDMKPRVSEFLVPIKVFYSKSLGYSQENDKTN